MESSSALQTHSFCTNHFQKQILLCRVTAGGAILPSPINSHTSQLHHACPAPLTSSSTLALCAWVAAGGAAVCASAAVYAGAVVVRAIFLAFCIPTGEGTVASQLGYARVGTAALSGTVTVADRAAAIVCSRTATRQARYAQLIATWRN